MGRAEEKRVLPVNLRQPPFEPAIEPIGRSCGIEIIVVRGAALDPPDRERLAPPVAGGQAPRTSAENIRLVTTRFGSSPSGARLSVDLGPRLVAAEDDLSVRAIRSLYPARPEYDVFRAPSFSVFPYFSPAAEIPAESSRSTPRA